MSGGHVFISYSHKDRDYVGRLVDYTRDLGFDVFWDGELEVGGRWHRELMAKIRTCAAFVIVMTPNSEQSERVENELLVADESDGVTIVPILYDGHRFDYLRSRHGILVDDGALPGDDFRARLAGTTSHAGLDQPDVSVSKRAGTRAGPDGMPPGGFGSATSDYAKYITDQSTERAAALTTESRLLADQLNFSDSAAKVDEALEVAPDFVPALVNRAWLASGQHNWTAALEAADRAVAIDPAHPLAHGNRAVALVGQRRLAEANKAIEQAIVLDPDDVRHHWMHGGILADLGEFDLALAAYDQALTISPEIKQLQAVRKIMVARKWASKVGIGRRRTSRRS